MFGEIEQKVGDFVAHHNHLRYCGVLPILPRLASTSGAARLSYTKEKGSSATPSKRDACVIAAMPPNIETDPQYPVFNHAATVYSLSDDG